jgi:diguanylate cyclase (GGDEF)-like protein
MIAVEIRSLGTAALLCFGLAAQASDGQRLVDLSPPNFENYGVKDGLSDEIYSTVGIDHRGFVWAGSASGLYRFDGYRWQRYDVGGASSLVRDMLTDSEGQLWAIFEREGLAAFQDGEWSLTGETAFHHRFNSSLAPSGQRSHWLTRSNRVLRLETGRWIGKPEWTPPGTNRITSIALTHEFGNERRLWVARSQGELWTRPFDRLDAAWEAAPIGDMAGALFTDLVVTRSNGFEELWVLSYGSGILRLRSDGEQRRWRKHDGSLPSEAIYSGIASYDSNGQRSFWVASRGGLLRFENDALTAYDQADGLPSNAIRGIKRLDGPNGEDILWLATERGVTRMRLAPSAWRTVSRLGADENGVFGVFADRDVDGNERVVMGSGQAGLAVFSQGQWTRFNRANGRLPSDRIRGTWPVDRPGELGLVSLENGRLFLLSDDLELDELTVNWPLDQFHGAIDVVEAFGQILIGTLDSEIWRLEGRRLVPLHASALTNGSLRSLAVQMLPGGGIRVWGATSEGLVRLSPSSYELVKDTESSSGISFRDVEVVQEGERQILWASTERQGVLRYDITDPDAPVRLDEDNRPPAPDPTIYSVRADSVGRLYICTNNGVQQLTPLPNGGYSERVFRRRDGLVHDECNSRSQFIDAEDRFWVGTLAGLSVFDPSAFEEASPGNRAASPLRLTYVEFDGHRYPGDRLDQIRIPAGAATFSVQATLLTQQREANNQYRFSLLDQTRPTLSSASEWSRQPFEVWPATAPGQYSLRVEARDFAGIEAAALTLPVYIEATWFQRPLTRVALLGGVVLLLFGLGALYTRQLRRRKARLETLVLERTEDLARANRQLTELSFVDPLTNVANRRRLDRAGRDEIRRSIEQGQKLSLILLDLDHFKRFNDRHGHLAGDEALRCVARSIEQIMRSGDLLARFGGEEFACLLPNTSASQAAAIAERAREAVLKESEQTLARRFGALTISAGVATSRPGETALASLIDRADKALYQAKRSGRNRIISTNGTEEPRTLN